jgi:hypothetical protein
MFLAGIQTELGLDPLRYSRVTRFEGGSSKFGVIYAGVWEEREGFCRVRSTRGNSSLRDCVSTSRLRYEHD